MSASTSNQQAIWSHFQTERISAFDGAYWRLGRLVDYAAQRHHTPAAPAVINIGIGNGYLELLAIQRGWKVMSVDPDETAVTRLRASGVDARGGVIEELPFESDSADVVFASEVFEHLTPESLSAGLREIQRVLKTGGHLIGTVPFHENLGNNECVCPKCAHIFHRWGHQQSFTPERMRTILSHALEVEICEPRYFPAWKLMDMRSRINAALRIVLLNRIGIHRPNENIIFIARNH